MNNYDLEKVVSLMEDYREKIEVSSVLAAEAVRDIFELFERPMPKAGDIVDAMDRWETENHE